MISQIKQALKPVYIALFASSRKRRSELSYWKRRFSTEGQTLSNAHHEPLYTTAFGLTKPDFNAARLAGAASGRDTICGPVWLNFRVAKRIVAFAACSAAMGARRLAGQPGTGTRRVRWVHGRNERHVVVEVLGMFNGHRIYCLSKI
jgi:hypothetical protein